MRFLLPIGGELPEHFAGVLTSPGHFGVVAAIQQGKAWAADNQAYTQGFDGVRFGEWLETMLPFRETCLFVACPDSVGDATRTSQLWKQWQPVFLSWPLAYVGQDGETNIPDNAQALFVGGSTAWKVSADARRLIDMAIERRLHVHIGRVNWGKRYRHFQSMRGSENFTCDGTRTRFDGREKTLNAWTQYQKQGVLVQWLFCI